MHNLQDDIEKYLSGKLSPAEMHALEKKALDDPFLAEAIEGGSAISPDDFIADVKSLQSSISAKANQKGSPQSFYWKWPLRIAAGLLLLAASTFIVLNIVDEKANTNSIALNKTEEETQPGISTPGLSDSVSSDDEITVKQEAIQSATEASPEKTERRVKEEDQPKETAEETKPNFALDSEKPKEHLEEIIVEEKAEADEVIISPSLAQEELKKDDRAKMKRSVNEKEDAKRRSADVAQSAPSGAPVSAKIKVPSKIIKGKVTDKDDGLPLPGVNVSVKGASVGTVTDLNGNYQIAIQENQNNVMFSYIGMESQEIAIQKDENATEINVQMAPDVSELSEVVVTGYGTGEEKEFEGTMWELTEPVGGKKEYRNYLEKNIQYPQVALENNIEGKVTVQFTVEPSGLLTDFRVVKSLGSGCDDEVIRLIKEGPKWTPTKRNSEPVKSKAKVKLRFELPKKKGPGLRD